MAIKESFLIKFLMPLIILTFYIISLRPLTTPLPFTNIVVVEWIDSIWKKTKIAEGRDMKERFESTWEGFIASNGHGIPRFSRIYNRLISGDFLSEIVTPYSGEPLELPSKLRKFPEIEVIYFAGSDSFDIYLTHRIHEGIYPVLLNDNPKERYHLFANSSVGSCLVVVEAREATVARCN